MAEDVAVSVTVSAWAGSLTDDQRSGFLKMMRAGGDDSVVDYQFFLKFF